MTLSFIGLVFFGLEYLFYKHSQIKDRNHNYYKPLLPLWLFIAAFLVNMIPIINIISFICVSIFYTNACLDGKFKCNGLEVKIIKAIYNFFTRSV